MCVYFGPEKVVDLWGSTADSPNATFYGPDTLQSVCSSTKCLTAIAFASGVVDKGLVRYEDKVSRFWPEFAANEKENVTIADVMRHEAGLANFRKVIAIYPMCTHNETFCSYG